MRIKSGILGGNGLFGGGSAAADRSAQLQSQGQLGNVFSWALPAGEQETQQGETALSEAAGFDQSLLTAGRTQTAQRIAPAINAQLASTDAGKRQAAIAGDSRSGGTTAAHAEAGTKASGNIDNMISTALTGGQQQGAAGLAQIGGTEAATGANLTGQATNVEEDLLSSAIQSRGLSSQIQQQMGQNIGGLAAYLASEFGF